MQHQEEEEALSAPDPVSSEWRSKCPKRTGSEEVIHHTEDLGPRLRECSKVRPSMVSGGRIYQEELESRGDLLFPVLADQPASHPTGVDISTPSPNANPIGASSLASCTSLRGLDGAPIRPRRSWNCAEPPRHVRGHCPHVCLHAYVICRVPKLEHKEARL